jgi:hypothetical protein
MKLQYDLKENLYWIYIEENENGIKHITTKKKSVKHKVGK